MFLVALRLRSSEFALTNQLIILVLRTNIACCERILQSFLCNYYNVRFVGCDLVTLVDMIHN